MIYLGVALAVVMSAAAPALAHEATLDHAGTSYRLRYEPKVEVRTKTVGHSFGTRPSTERCRWTMQVQVERHIQASDTAQPLSRLLPDTHSIGGEALGNCRQNARAIASAQEAGQADIRSHVAAVASADRSVVLAEIDAARALALN
ncbi:MAG TPA: hypothetical protein VF475_07310 [Sphingobium sp.]